MAVLSAVPDEQGPEISGEMAMGISRAFLVAKARRVVASQWSVEDKAACEFAKHFLRKVAPGLARRHAVRMMPPQ